ncbi:NADH-quinone oxidoreductase subunit L [Prosthecochloris sp. N3]|uniref:NADH-quinone oxidoreductase subunit L n=1 Tax=Prosthecochloris ethylica TaxID=2743976 RepID=A0ABR9XSS8_9CHLB|nr:NADH-quinone oxidoreductase subunit L [Prosthecochloris ethylica]MBF0586657.1 NADH-quinone oxidoreductase subunit L [Prosthecochloris ethylica]MBF0636989.1 NADH-quinone oxidoreductase subunit L [Prosthecochloris ethylica]NUK47860.1 NADH-quinone oxidoreductase subunit L [Prosthecochloris ethylica]
MHSLIQLSIIVLLLPLLSFVLLIFFNRRLPRGGDFLGIGFLGATFAISVYIFWEVVVTAYDPSFRIAWDFTWIDFGDVPGVGPLEIRMGIMIDNLTAIMLAMVSLISFLVHLYSTGYMQGERYYGRFFAYLGIFTFSMLGIVLSDNLFSIYIFWELVGLSSYLLIGFYFHKDSAADAQKKAFLTNRVGDIGMWLGILILYSQFHTFGYEEIYLHIRDGEFHMSQAWLTAAGILLFMGCVGKSAQFPLHVWLPDAMEGPTPVSALIHAATMVAAGVYFVGRIFPVLTPDALAVIAFVGAVTAFMAATIAITQHDIKRVLAYSTVSQLGYMVLGLGVGAYSAGLFHLLTHAFFKACLFLGSGAIIHAMHHEQDMRWMGGLWKKMPWTFVTFIVATLALAGLPLTSGFMSKDAILAGALGYAEVEGGGIYYLIPALGFFSAMLTAFYMGRQIWLVFFGKSRTHLKPVDEHHGDHAHDDHGHHEVHEVAWNMRLPLVVLAGLSVFAVYSPDPLDGAKGWFMHLVQTPQTAVVSSGGVHEGEHLEAAMYAEAAGHGEAAVHDDTHAVDAQGHQAVEAHDDHGEHHGPVFDDPRQAAIAHAAHANHDTAIRYSTIMVASGIGLALIVYAFGWINPEKTARRIRPLYLYSFNKWYWDEIYNATVIRGSLLISRILAWFDSNIVDGLVNGAGALTRRVGFFAGGVDRYVVDGLVNFTAFFVQTTGSLLKKIQTGRVQTYLVMVLLAVTAYIVYYVFQIMP